MELRIAHNPQIPGPIYRVPVESLAEAVKIQKVLCEYDLFQYDHNIKPDYCNMCDLEERRPEEIDKADPDDDGWYSWHDSESDMGFGEYCRNLES